MKIHTLLILLALAPFGSALVSPAQAAPLAMTLQTAPTTVAAKDDSPRKPAPKPGPRTGGEGE